MEQRAVHWDGFFNARDLGGLPTHDGRTTRFGVVVRSEHPSHLTATGWRQLRGAGVRAIVSLYTAGLDDGARVGTLDRKAVSGAEGSVGDLVHRAVAVEDGSDVDFLHRWGSHPSAAALNGGLLATPLYWSDALTRWPERYAAAVAAVADAPAGGVLVHCGRGCDRTGLVSALLLTLAGVEPHVVAGDYALSASCLRPRFPHYPEHLERVLAAHDTDVVGSVVAQLAAMDVEAVLRAGGLSDEQVLSVRRRLVQST
ncbi:tyrosine-protein phosphatase [Kineococcus arenarius]|uniref:tyrosine-protein phosphatase n=1 Tax=unclassified Kineococcus TaxID=2621656 RepID=UPI003D7D59F9